MRILTLTLSLFFFLGCSFQSLQAAALPIEPSTPVISIKKSRLQKRINRLENRLAKAKSSKRQKRLRRKIDRLQEGSIVGLAATLAGIVGIGLGVATIIIATPGSILMYLGMLLGVGAIIFGIVDMRYAESFGLSWAGIVLGGLALIACIAALIIVG